MKASSEHDSQVMGKPLSEIPCAVLSSLAGQSPHHHRPPGARRELVFQCSLAFTLNLGMEGVRGSQMGKASPVGHGEQIRFHRTQPGWSGKRRGSLLMAGVHFLAQSCSASPRAQEECGSPDRTYHPHRLVRAQNSGSQPEAAPRSLGMGCE